MLNLLLRKKATAREDNAIQVPAELRGQIHIDEINQVVFANEALKRREVMLTWLAEARHEPRLATLRVEWERMGTVTERIQQAHHDALVVSRDDNLDEEVRGECLALLREGAESGVSDIHIHRKERHTEIMFRINGTLVVAHELTNDHADRLIRAMYTLASSRDSAYSEGESQDAAVAGDVLKGTGLANVRIVKGPCLPVSEGGKFMILRLQYARSGSARRGTQPAVEFHAPRRPEGHLKLLGYGFSQDQVDRILNISIAPSGVLICTGPTGSGKTTLLFETLQHKARTEPGRRLVTIEQPAEYPMPWAIQMDISNALSADAAGKEFKARLRNALRMDPDDMMVGEIRDTEVALTTFDAAQTGHFVVTTLHVDDPFDYPLRLQNMDYERLSFRTTCNASIVRGIVGQRLLPTLCPHCAVPWKGDDDRMPRRTREAVPTWGPDPSRIRRAGPGCHHCLGTGIGGRTAVAEVVETDEELMSDFVRHGVSVARHRFRARKGVDASMVETAMGRVFAGLVDPYQVTAKVDRIRTYDAVMAERAAGAAEAA
ncbi:Flp pilus assembly complex ATPase component TadA [Gluconacetobacter aggeris]|uniref:Flp pilus assembly complex ATPase component TadA n=2 Tax=Gluconacetobacter TaxID=89583 RepID=A0A7W4NVJ8_9PROT|nr:MULTISPECIES: ATPase, T2SS/T4P/T4SS family [Gluconacetobacter]MBB2164490.1 Flp pilus assembly complex ATPase component TadA [Gluconacetobacter dulcium]MBB2169950.1 Flp pilus assembly complex ATPase component TadA [Gluconacetobacter aggeris]MBB2193743.1 Flp pilus assembly complex ATPase component TadA [Gluconacetobacter dulcium]